ncbi:MAG: pilus assembly protein TadG-related protein [Acidimicrobiales bacterium]
MTGQPRERGATLVIVAMLLPVLILMTAFAVDLGRQRSSRRTMQARADIVALDMIRLADGRNITAITAGDGTHASAATALSDSASRNSIPLTQIGPVEWGTWSAPSGFIPTAIGTAIPNAVRITTSETTKYFFQPGSGGVTRQAVATSGADPLAGFSIGSFGASLSAENAGLLNSALTPILGSPAGINVLSYQGLATATLGVGALGAQLGLITPTEVLTTSVGASEMLEAAAAVLQANGDTANATILQNMAATPQTQALPPLTIGQLVHAETAGQTAAISSSIDALSIVTAAAFLSQCTNPTDLATCSGINIPTLSFNLPLLSVTGSLKVIQAAVSAYGPVGTSARNSQVEATVGTVIGAQSVGSCVPKLSNLFCLLNGILVGAVDAKVTINATLRLADGTGTISAIDCGSPLGLDLLTTTGLYDLTLDVVVEFGRRGVLGGVLGPLLGSLHLVGSTSQTNTNQTIAFDVPPDVLGTTTKQAGAGTVGLSTLSLSTVGGTGVLGTLGNLGINKTVGQVTSTLVNPLLTVLDTQVLGPLTDVVGLNVVGADLTAQAIECDNTILALVE